MRDQEGRHAVLEVMQIVSHLEEVARIDTVYRDVYLRRAGGLLSPVIAEVEYRRAHKDGELIDDLLRQLHSTLARHECLRVQALVEQIRIRREAFEANRAAHRAPEIVQDFLGLEQRPGVRSAAGHSTCRCWSRSPLGAGYLFSVGATFFFESEVFYEAAVVLLSFVLFGHWTTRARRHPALLRSVRARRAGEVSGPQAEDDPDDRVSLQRTPNGQGIRRDCLLACVAARRQMREELSWPDC